jgi:hypothetical protein
MGRWIAIDDGPYTTQLGDWQASLTTNSLSPKALSTPPVESNGGFRISMVKAAFA